MLNGGVENSGARAPGRDEELEARASEGGWGDQDVAPVGPGDPTQDGQAEPEPVVGAARLRAPVENVEHALPLRGRNPGAGILDDDGAAPVRVEHAHAHGLAPGG